MEFSNELTALLPQDIPERNPLISKGSRHLELIVEANRNFNLTRVTSPREAAIKHVVDSVLPWRLFAGATHILDAGTGAGFPGIPLAIVLPSVRFTLAESIGKKARFVEDAVRELGLRNVTVAPRRAEDFLRTSRADIIAARAVAPVGCALRLFGPALRQGTRALLYKGPDAETEITEAAAELRRAKIEARILERYELPDGLGSRTILELR